MNQSQANRGLSHARRLVFAGWLSCLAILLAAPTSARGQNRPSWTCLPDDTIVVARIPGGNAFVDALRKQTKLGSVVFAQARYDKALAKMREENGETWEEITAALARYGLRVEDWPRFFDGELGYGLVFHKRGPEDIGVTGLAWLEPGEDLAGRLVTAISKAVEQQSNDPHPVTRIDEKIGAQTVIRLTVPIFDTDPASTDDADPFIEDDTVGQQKLAVAAQPKAEAPAAKANILGQVHLFIVRIGGRMLLAHTVPTDFSGADQQDGDQDVQTAAAQDAATLDETRSVFGRFLAAHSGTSAAAPAFAAVPGAADVLPPGVPIVELTFDPRPLLKAFMGQDPMQAQALEVSGVKSVGPIVIRGALDKTLLRWGTLISVPAPRAGFLSLLDQPPLAPEPPEWVPTDVFTYGHFSLDLAATYKRIRELVTSTAGQVAVQQFQVVESGVQDNLGTSLVDLLAAFGQQHIVVSYEPDVAVFQNWDPTQGTLAMYRQAFVWQVKNEAAMQKLMAKLTEVSAASQGFVTPADEQGFKGLRIQSPPNLPFSMQGGLFLGRGYLVLGIGKDVVERTLATLRTPPTGEAALKRSPTFARARALLPPTPGTLYELTDSQRSAKLSKQMFMAMSEAALKLQNQGQGILPKVPLPGAIENELDRKMVDWLKSMFPSDDELEGMFGVTVGDGWMSPNGLALRWISELPAP